MVGQEEGEEVEGDGFNPPPILHVVVVGFHHKKGCQVEFAYPPLMPGGESHSAELPSQWRHLPSLALPDGSHNHTQDTVYFHLPALHNPRQTVFGISCYRQIDADKVKNRTEDMTRGTVQKSVVVLSRLPLYGQIQVKMSLITQAYFEEGDFGQTDLILQTYRNLNDCLNDDMLHTQQLYVGLSARDLVSRYRQKLLLLFKLFLLERKVLFFKSPVVELSGDILTLLSLFPGLLESGLSESACIVPEDTPESSPQHSITQHNEEENESREEESPQPGGVQSYLPNSASIQSLSSSVKDRLSGALGFIAGTKSPSSEVAPQGAVSPGEEGAVEDGVEAVPPPETLSFAKVTALSTQQLGLPLRVFTGGNLCHPYLSLPYIDILSQPSILGYVIGATNALFKAKGSATSNRLWDVLVDIEEDRMVDIQSPELKRALSLTTEDLRFIDHVIRVVVFEEGRDEFLEGVGWEGGDEWVRAQFRFYLAGLLRTSLESRERPALVHLYNSHYMAALEATRWYQAWARTPPPPALAQLPPGHPCEGQLSVADVRLRLSHTIHNTEGGKRVHAAVANTTRVVADTGKVVAGGIGAAKGAISAWWGGRSRPEAPPSKSPSPASSPAE